MKKIILAISVYWNWSYNYLTNSIKKNFGKIRFYAVLFLLIGITITIIQSLNNYRYNELKKLYVHETIQRQIENKRIEEKVDNLTVFISKMYPSFNYKAKVIEAKSDNEKINELPVDIYQFYIQENFIKPHGLENYERTLKNTVSPMNEKTSFIACAGGEFGMPRPYSYYGYKHEGNDVINFAGNGVMAVYNMLIWNKTYSEETGYTIEAKFEYENEEGKMDWYFIRYRHLAGLDDFVKKGDLVEKSEIIGTMGDTGIWVTKAHLHVELFKWVNGKWKCINFYKNSTWNNKYLDCI